MALIWFFILFSLFGLLRLAYSSEVEAKLLNQIKSIYGDQEIMVKFHNLPKDVLESQNIKGIIMTKLPDLKGDGQAVVEIGEKNGRTRTVYVTFKVFRMQKFYVLKRDLKKGEIIKSSDLSEKTAILSDNLTYPSSLEEVEGKKLKKDVLANTPITKDLLEEAYVVKKGDVVTAKIENEKMRISAKVISLEKGKIGDLIRVKNISSGKEIWGIVSADKEITVLF